MGGRGIAPLVLLLLAACATAPVAPPVPAPGVLAADTPFAIDGRLSARRAGEAVAAHFSWRHAPPRDEFVVTTPLGQTVAEISGDSEAGRYEFKSADGRHDSAQDWAALTERALGAPLPVRGLASWILARPHPGTPYSIEPDAAGRAAVLRQDGWEIVYAYADDAALAPARLQLVHPEVEIRIVVLQRHP
jgi:outer membrane lipoprotein LolB